MDGLLSATSHEGTSDKRVVAALRQMIIDGTLEAGAKVSEVSVSSMFDVSRTPARLALKTLEVEGLIRKRDGRGFTVLELNFGDVSRAYEVRGVLEGLAAATLARGEIRHDVLDHLGEAVSDMDRILANQIPLADKIADYHGCNTDFHVTIMRECGNEFVGFAMARLETLPLMRLGTVVFNEEKAAEEEMRLRFGNMQHRLIVDAIARRDPQRAEALMREHANQVPVYTALFV